MTGKDRFSRTKRSEIMRAVRQRGTAPEMAVGAILRDLAARYRLNHPGLRGRPDFANRTRGWAIFVHGCFWHGHRYCKRTGGQRTPVANRSYWTAKIERNRQRDAAVKRALRDQGMRVLVIWECDLGDRRKVERRIRGLLLHQ